MSINRHKRVELAYQKMIKASVKGMKQTSLKAYST